jgi:hypothetical protein
MAIVVVILTALLSAACGNGPTEPTPPSSSNPTTPPIATSTTTRLSFTSDPASLVGQGESRTYTLQNATFIPIIGHVGRYLSVVVQPKDPANESLNWGAVILAPFGTVLAPGTYSATPGGSFDNWMFDFFGGGRSCGSGTTSTLRISEVAVTGDQLQRLRASFIMYCGGSATVRGELVVLADPWR